MESVYIQYKYMCNTNIYIYNICIQYTHTVQICEQLQMAVYVEFIFHFN